MSTRRGRRSSASPWWARRGGFAVRLLTALVAGAAVAFGTASPAGAHVVYQEQEVYCYTPPVNDMAVVVWAEVSHGSGGGYAKGRTEISDCAFNFFSVGNQPPNEIAIRFDYYYKTWDGPSGSYVYVLCYSHNWDYNESWDYDKVVAVDFGPSAPCGLRIYGTQAFGKFWEGGAWRPTAGGGAVWSGEHTLGGSGK